jgi:hypothetical protein
MKHWSPGARSDDPAVRVVHAPTAAGIGTGQAFFFLFGYKRASLQDQDMLARELAAITDDVETLRAAGYTVVVDPQAVHADFVAAVTGAGAGAEGLVPAGFYWSAHGDSDGGLECCDGAILRPEDVDPEKVAPGLRLAVLGACYVGAHSRTWRRALGGRPLVVGWGRPVTIGRAVDFLEPDAATTTDLDDLLQRWLLTERPLPVEAPPVALPEPARAGGRIGALAERIPLIAEMLHGSWADRPTYLLLEVPLPERRRPVVEIFLLDAVDPFIEGEVLIGIEGDVGEISELITPEMLLSGLGRPGFGRVALVRSEQEMPRIVTQAFLPLEGTSDKQLAAQIYQVAARADALSYTVFG